MGIVLIDEVKKRAKQLMDAEEMEQQEAIEVACEQIEEDGLLGDFTYLELVEETKSTLPW